VTAAHATDRPHRFTVERYLALVDADPALEGTELLGGVICDVSAEYKPHRDAVEDVFWRLAAVVGRRAHVAGSVEVASDSIWNPDAYVERVDADPERPVPHISELELAVEVSVSTGSRDMGVKERGYAAGGVPQYWIVVPGANGHALICEDPKGERYRTVRRIDLPNGHTDLPVEELWVEWADH
jgi:Uma2 family endonuclease